MIFDFHSLIIGWILNHFLRASKFSDSSPLASIFFWRWRRTGTIHREALEQSWDSVDPVKYCFSMAKHLSSFSNHLPMIRLLSAQGLSSVEFSIFGWVRTSDEGINGLRKSLTSNQDVNSNPNSRARPGWDELDLPNSATPQPLDCRRIWLQQRGRSILRVHFDLWSG